MPRLPAGREVSGNERHNLSVYGVVVARRACQGRSTRAGKTDNRAASATEYTLEVKYYNSPRITTMKYTQWLGCLSESQLQQLLSACIGGHFTVP
ncbi:MAG TPA: hypothetical protein PLR06_06505 [Cyclobacteriaceae bacterium]|nr:hypothetical protein [Cyclobacteriaceae bacterium]